jgi:dynein heavy chain
MFPRFYFLSNDELLEILAKAGDLEAIQKNMKKCFDGVHKLILSEGGVSRNIIGMQSQEGEKILFTGRIVSPKGDVEIWLSSFQESMREILYKNMKKGKLDYEGTNKERHEWVLDHSA